MKNILVKYLVKNGPYISEQGSDGNTPLINVYKGENEELA